MTALEKDLRMEQGATFTLPFKYCRPTLDGNGQQVLDGNGQPVPGEPFLVEDCTVRMQIRQRKGEPVLIEATTENQRIFLGSDSDPDTAGRIEIELTDQDTEALTFKKCVYDLELQWPLVQGRLRPRVDRLMHGTVFVVLNITEES